MGLDVVCLSPFLSWCCVLVPMARPRPFIPPHFSYIATTCCTVDEKTLHITKPLHPYTKLAVTDAVTGSCFFSAFETTDTHPSDDNVIETFF